MERLEILAVRVANTWTLEVGAALISASSLAALVGVLIAANGQPILDWQWHNVTLNALVSVLSTISRLSALYVLSAAIGQTKWILFSRGPASLLDFEAIDLASRGFAGCARILFKTRKLVLVGALAVLVALAFDPFAQQLVQLHSEILYAPSENTTMPVAKRYDAGSLTFAFGSTLLDSGLKPVDAKADFGMQSAVLGGLTQQKAVIDGQMPLHCRSGNCTWNAVRSLAVCSTCNDVTPTLHQWNTNMSAIVYLSTLNPSTFYGKALTYGLGDNLFLNNADGPVSLAGALLMTAYGTGDPKRTASLKNIDTLVWATGVIQAVQNTAANNTWPTGFTVSATECALYYCVKDYDINVTENKVIETSTEITSARRVPGSWQYVDAKARRYGLN